MGTCDPTDLESEALRSAIEGLELNQPTFSK